MFNGYRYKELGEREDRKRLRCNEKKHLEVMRKDELDYEAKESMADLS